MSSDVPAGGLAGGIEGVGAAGPPHSQTPPCNTSTAVPAGKGKERFRAAVRAVIQEQRLHKARTAGDRILAAARHQHELLRFRDGGIMATLGRAAHSAIMGAFHSASMDAPQLSQAQRASLHVEFDAFDKDKTGLLPIKQLEKLLQKRAYHRSKNRWKDECRRRAKTEMVSSPQQSPGDHQRAEAFHYSSRTNKEDRQIAMRAAKDAFSEYSCHTDGMDFETFCAFHVSLGGTVSVGSRSVDFLTSGSSSFEFLEDHPSGPLTPSFSDSWSQDNVPESPLRPVTPPTSHPRPRTSSKLGTVSRFPSSPVAGRKVCRSLSPRSLLPTNA